MSKGIQTQKEKCKWLLRRKVVEFVVWVMKGELPSTLDLGKCPKPFTKELHCK